MTKRFFGAITFTCRRYKSNYTIEATMVEIGLAALMAGSEHSNPPSFCIVKKKCKYSGNCNYETRNWRSSET
jgi:hypothetical protein